MVHIGCGEAPAAIRTCATFAGGWPDQLRGKAFWIFPARPSGLPTTPWRSGAVRGARLPRHPASHKSKLHAVQEPRNADVSTIANNID